MNASYDFTYTLKILSLDFKYLDKLINYKSKFQRRQQNQLVIYFVYYYFLFCEVICLHCSKIFT